jgi:hypothetical protein
LGFALRQKKISVEVIEEVLSDLFLNREAQGETSKEVQPAEPQSAGIEAKASHTKSSSTPAEAEVSSAPAAPKVSNPPAEPAAPQVSPAEPKVSRIFDEPWVSHTPIESLCLGVLPHRGELKDSPEAVGQPHPDAQVSVPAPQSEEELAPVNSRAKFSYTFAMGCVPRPAQVSGEAPPPKEQTRAAAPPVAPSFAIKKDGARDEVAPGRRDSTQITGAAGMARTAAPSSSSLGK